MPAVLSEAPGILAVTFTRGNVFSKLITIAEKVPPASTYSAKNLTGYTLSASGDFAATISSVDLSAGKINVTIAAATTQSLNVGNYEVSLKWESGLDVKTFLKIQIRLG